MIYVRFARRASRSTDAAAKHERDGQGARRRSCRRAPSRWSIANIGMPQNARSAAREPERRAQHGVPAARVLDPEQRKLSQDEIADEGARDPRRASFPGVEVLQYPGGLVASVFANGYTAPLVVEVADDNLAEMNEQAQAIADVARTVAGVRDVKESLQIDYPEMHVDTDREKAGFVGVDARARRPRRRSRRRSATSTRPGVWIDSDNGQSYYVVTYYDGAQVADTQALGALPGARRARRGARCSSARTATSCARARRRSPSSETTWRASRTCCMQTEGRDIGSAAERPREGAEEGPAAPGTSTGDFVGQIELMRTTFSGLGLALGPRRDGRVHDHGVAVQVAAAAVRHALHDPRCRSSASSSR